MESIFSIVSMSFKYIFIVIIYFFIYRILKLIYLDVKSIDSFLPDNNAYIKLVNKRNTLPFKIQEHYSIKNVLSIGRSGDNDVVIPNQFVSKNHCDIVMDEGSYFIRDKESSNGTILNGEKIEDVVKLKDGDRFIVGIVEFLFVKGNE